MWHPWTRPAAPSQWTKSACDLEVAPYRCHLSRSWVARCKECQRQARLYFAPKFSVAPCATSRCHTLDPGWAGCLSPTFSTTDLVLYRVQLANASSAGTQHHQGQTLWLDIWSLPPHASGHANDVIHEICKSLKKIKYPHERIETHTVLVLVCWFVWWRLLSWHTKYAPRRVSISFR